MVQTSFAHVVHKQLMYNNYYIITVTKEEIMNSEYLRYVGVLNFEKKKKTIIT